MYRISEYRIDNGHGYDASGNHIGINGLSGSAAAPAILLDIPLEGPSKCPSLSYLFGFFSKPKLCN
jgi:hypothetical protein